EGRGAAQERRGGARRARGRAGGISARRRASEPADRRAHPAGACPPRACPGAAPTRGPRGQPCRRDRGGGLPDPCVGETLLMNDQRIARNIVTIGASAGGVEALMQLFTLLPRDLPAAIAFVIHRSPVYETRLPWLLGQRTPLRVAEPRDGQRLEPGWVYAAPRDQHLVMENGHLRTFQGPKEHRTRPAIDPL